MKDLKRTSLLREILLKESTKTNLSVPQLIEKVVRRREGTLTSTGAVRTITGQYTGRSPDDKFIVNEEISNKQIDWGEFNKKIDEKTFLDLYRKVINYLNQQEEIFVFNGYAGADKQYRLPIQVINEYAWHNLFAHQLFIRPNTYDSVNYRKPDEAFTVISAPSFKADPKIDGTNSEVFICISFKHRIILIGGTEYAGEIKKSIFSVMNFILPQKGILPMHCSANVGKPNDVALFFGLSGTGKTTLSADPHRKLIGDDEHAWSENGIFNIEGGCYAKCVQLSEKKEPQIYHAITFGSVLENVSINEQSREPDYNDTTLTENTRAAYPIKNIDNIAVPSIAGHPKTIIFLTADAFGVLPPISKLTKEQAMYHFLSGYTSKLAGTERGITKPKATFSACFGSPFLPLNPLSYTKMLGDKIEKFDTSVFLVNTGWTGGSYGKGNRIKLAYTRAMIHAALSGELKTYETVTDPIFGLKIPLECPGVPKEVLIPKNTWDSPAAYHTFAKKLAVKFHENFQKFTEVNEEIKNAGPVYQPNE